jgi:hypothetical protein
MLLRDQAPNNAEGRDRPGIFFSMQKKLTLVSVVFAMACGLGACGSSNARGPAAASAPISRVRVASPHAAGSRIPAAGGIAQFTSYSADDGPKSTVIVSGVIGDYGTAIRGAPNGGNLTQVLTLGLSRGSFQLSVGDLVSELQPRLAAFPANRDTCSGRMSATGSAPIVAGSGTGDYTGIRGTFATTLTITEVTAKTNPPCNSTSPFLAQAVITTGTGTVSLKASAP